MPIPPDGKNTTSENDSTLWAFWRNDVQELDSEHGHYSKALRDPKLWEIYAEERPDWSTNATLHEGPFGEPVLGSYSPWQCTE